jgi:hypothetical protein
VNLFKIHGALTPTSQDVEFKTVVDEDGDLTIKANGVNLVFLSSLDGILYKYYVNSGDQDTLPALNFQDNALKID